MKCRAKVTTWIDAEKVHGTCDRRYCDGQHVTVWSDRTVTRWTGDSAIVYEEPEPART